MLHGYTDSDWMGSTVDRKNTSGYCFSLGLAMISSSSKKQGSIAQSTAEAVLWAMEAWFLLDQEIIVETKLKQYPKVLFQEPRFLLDQEIIVETKLKQYPKVLFRSTVLSIQSKFVYP
jgi:hypothetical protein